MATILFEDDGLEVQAPIGTGLRDLAQNEGSSIPFGCEQGICGTCFSNIETGMDCLSAMEEQEKETLEALGGTEGQRLICQCRVEKDGTVHIKSAH